MKAMVLHEHGGVDRLAYEENFADPVAEPGEVVLAVEATSLNYHDLFTCRGMPGIRIPLPVIIGIDIAGVVIDVGPQVEGWAVGDRVLVDPLDPQRGLIGETRHGGLAERCAVPARQLVRLPDGVDFTAAAALPVAYGTAYRMLMTHGKLQPGETVLVMGASGGVGTGCVQIAKMLGARVIACAGSDDKMEALRRLGVDDVINYRTEDFVAEIQKRYGKPNRRAYTGGVDMVVNFTGGDTWVRSMKCLRRGGRLMTCGATAGFDPKTDLRYIWSFELQVQGSNAWERQDLEDLLALVAQGRITPPLDGIYPLAEAAEALRRLENRQIFGKVIVRPR